MKIIFVQPYYFNIWEALGIGYIAGYVRKHFSGTLDLKFFQGYFDSDDLIIQEAKDADIIAFSCTSPAYRAALTLARAAKQVNPSIRTVAGGFHPSALPEDSLKKGIMDQVVTGEGEKAFLEILNGNDSEIVTGKKFDELSQIFPDRDTIKNERTIDLCEKMTGQRIASFQSVRGCPFRCAFCAERTVSGITAKDNPLRLRAPGHILDEIEFVTHRYKLNYFKFADATWNTTSTSCQKITEFCEEKIKRNIKTPWEANVHATLITRDMLKTMKEAQCEMINVGCESGSQKILDQMKKGLKVEKIRDVFRWGQELGMKRRSFFILGMPDESPEDIQATEKLVEEIQPDVFGVTILCPYPGTDFYDAQKMKDYDWAVADEYSNPYWNTAHFSNPDLKDIQARLTNKFAGNLAWHNRIIKEKEI